MEIRVYRHVHFWPGSMIALGGLSNQVKSARFLATGNEIQFQQEKFRVRFVNLPEKAPDEPVTTLAIECDGEPHQDPKLIGRERPRLNVRGPACRRAVPLTVRGVGQGCSRQAYSGEKGAWNV
jgi:hypothetical protein